jgi:intracellular septation protein
MIRYGALFLTEAALNEAIWRTQPDQFWVVWHRPVLLAVSIAFSVAQLPFLMKHAKMGEAELQAEQEAKLPPQG